MNHLLIDENLPVVVLVPHNETYEKVVSNMEEVRARGGQVIADWPGLRCLMISGRWLKGKVMMMTMRRAKRRSHRSC